MELDFRVNIITNKAPSTKPLVKEFPLFNLGPSLISAISRPKVTIIAANTKRPSAISKVPP